MGRSHGAKAKIRTESETKNVARFLTRMTSGKSPKSGMEPASSYRDLPTPYLDHPAGRHYSLDFVGMMQSEQDASHLPRISTRFESNIVTWAYCRLMLQHFGYRFRFRLDVFIGDSSSSSPSALIPLLSSL
jgi:hypothetical protein